VALLFLLTTGCGVLVPLAVHQARQDEIAQSHTRANSKVAAAAATFRKMGTTVGYRADSIYVGTVDMPHLNALSADGGYFSITNGLLEADNPCLLWGVVAHEMAHDKLDHPGQQLRAQMAVGLASTAAGSIPIAGPWRVQQSV
jgi:predicted Zn-dependent protease